MEKFGYAPERNERNPRFNRNMESEEEKIPAMAEVAGTLGRR